MRKIVLASFVFLTLASTVLAATAPVSVRLPENTAWVGQRLPFFIELRAPGSFEGSASFDLPQLPGTLLIKIGSPVVSSEEIDGQSWFVQAHEFALFSQKSGTLKMPQFPVRFTARQGFTGSASDVQENFPGMEVDIRRPPGSEDIGFLITTESLKITEMWNPQPGAAEAGAIIKRTITQQAMELSGMALAPAPTSAPKGISVYPADAIIKDTIERGDFKGERIDTITYQPTQAGNFSLPELIYVWWNPKTEKLESQTLPAVNFQVTAPPGALSSQPRSANYFLWIGLLLAVCLLGGGIWQKKRIAIWLQQIRRLLNPPERVAAKKLLRACRRNDAHGAFAAWITWRNTLKPPSQLNIDLLNEVNLLEGHLFGPAVAGQWQGESLAKALETQLNDLKVKTINKAAPILPELN